MNEHARAAETCASVIRHPRSLFRDSPAWHAPGVTVSVGRTHFRLRTTRRRISCADWQRFAGGDPTVNRPPGGPLYLVSLAAVPLLPDRRNNTRQVLDTLAHSAGIPVDSPHRRFPSPETDRQVIVRHILVTRHDLGRLGRSAPARHLTRMPGAYGPLRRSA